MISIKKGLSIQNNQFIFDERVSVPGGEFYILNFTLKEEYNNMKVSYTIHSNVSYEEVPFSMSIVTQTNYNNFIEGKNHQIIWTYDVITQVPVEKSLTERNSYISGNYSFIIDNSMSGLLKSPIYRALLGSINLDLSLKVEFSSIDNSSMNWELIFQLFIILTILTVINKKKNNK
ncbi:MAG: hypothetical protein ACXAC7_15960 [Candidatus Hodarchaeales archaeon]|jgi:hypothetical protein